VLPVSILNFCLEESLRVIRGGAGWRDRLSTAGESNLADIYLMWEAMKRILNSGATDQLRTWLGKKLSEELSSVM
jgi:hypothetical protein